MPRLALALSLALLGSCATAPKVVKEQPLMQTCAEVARQLENGASLTPTEKRELVERIKDLLFHWQVRVLAVSDETSRGELVNGMTLDVECADRAGTTSEGMRYLFSLYFERRVPELAGLAKGATLTVDGKVTSYEGQGAFAGKAKAYLIE